MLKDKIHSRYRPLGTPVGETYPAWETHANVISGPLDGKLHSQLTTRSRW